MMPRRRSRDVPYATNPLLRVKLPAGRSRFVMVLLAVGFVALAGRAVYLQAISNEFLKKQGESRYLRTIELPASRGKIVDRNGVTLASSLPARAVWAIPGEFDAPREKMVQVARLLNIPEKELNRKVADEDRGFVYLKRQVEANVAEQVAKLNLPGIYLRNEYKRYYPEGETVAHVVGFTNVEDNGQEGIELAQNSTLAGRAGSRRVIKDRLGQVVQDVGAIQEPNEGGDVSLTIDTRIQYLAHNALRDAVREHRAKAGAAVVLDVRTGEILALANWPTYNPNQREKLTGAQMRNRALTDIFEPGSTLKPFTIAMALDQNRLTPHSVIQTAPGRLTIGPDTIHDAHTYGPLTVEQVIQKSSNIGTAKIALTMPAQQMWESYTAVGFGQAPKIGFPGAVAGRLRPAKSWKPIEQATMSYGHGIAVSLVQLARAYTVFARDGEMMPVTLLKQPAPAQPVRVFRPETARAVRKMLEMVAGPDGTAPRAQVAGFRVGGKTGTSHKEERGRYVNKYVSTFVGLAPISDPRYIVAVTIDEPSAGKHFAGQVAAPLFAKITEDTLRVMAVTPDAPVATVVIPDNAAPENL